jgi:hypothetical protein
MQSDSKLLSQIPWLTNGTPDNNLESLCTSGALFRTIASEKYDVLWFVKRVDYNSLNNILTYVNPYVEDIN